MERLTVPYQCSASVSFEQCRYGDRSFPPQPAATLMESMHICTLVPLIFGCVRRKSSCSATGIQEAVLQATYSRSMEHTVQYRTVTHKQSAFQRTARLAVFPDIPVPAHAPVHEHRLSACMGAVALLTETFGAPTMETFRPINDRFP